MTRMNNLKDRNVFLKQLLNWRVRGRPPGPLAMPIPIKGERHSEYYITLTLNICTIIKFDIIQCTVKLFASVYIYW